MISEISRTPPSSVRKKLREEVYFGCPVEGCGSPYLSWHHFAPRWEEEKHHRVEGIIALCLQHHKEADVGAFTKQQLYEMKSSPYLKRAGYFPKGRFNWKREQLLVVVGGNYYFNTEIILKVGEYSIIWLSKDENGYDELNLDLRRADGSKLLNMEHNDWKIYTSFDDLECPPGGNSLSLRVKSEKISLDLKFSQLTKLEQIKAEIDRLSKKQQEHVQRELRVISQGLSETGKRHMRRVIGMQPVSETSLVSELVYRAMCNIHQENIALCKVKTRLKWPEKMQITELYLKTNRENQLVGNLFRGVGLTIKDGFMV